MRILVLPQLATPTTKITTTTAAKKDNKSNISIEQSLHIKQKLLNLMREQTEGSRHPQTSPAPLNVNSYHRNFRLFDFCFLPIDVLASRLSFFHAPNTHVTRCTHSNSASKHTWRQENEGRDQFGISTCNSMVPQHVNGEGVEFSMTRIFPTP